MLIYVGEFLLSKQNHTVYSGDTLHATFTCPPHSRYGPGIQVPSLWKLHPGSSSATKRLVSPANLQGRSKLSYDPPKLGGFTNTKLVYPESTLSLPSGLVIRHVSFSPQLICSPSKNDFGKQFSTWDSVNLWVVGEVWVYIYISGELCNLIFEHQMQCISPSDKHNEKLG